VGGDNPVHAAWGGTTSHPVDQHAELQARGHRRSDGEVLYLSTKLTLVPPLEPLELESEGRVAATLLKPDRVRAHVTQASVSRPPNGALGDCRVALGLSRAG